MKAVHFGAGNIGRGFIGLLLSQAGYEVCFVDVNDSLVSLLQQKGEYKVSLANAALDTFLVKGVTAIHGNDLDRVAEAVAEADLVTTAVGVNILKHIAAGIARGIEQRLHHSSLPLQVIACENAIGGSTQLKEHVLTHLSEKNRRLAEACVAFPDAAVDRIVPIQRHDDPLEVTVEPFYEWVIERSCLNSGAADIAGVHYVDELTPYIERKLFTVNTGHCTAAYLGYLRGFATIQEAMADPALAEEVQRVLEETGALLVNKYHFDADEHQRYIHKILERFRNPYLTDEVVRVGRSPIRKLSPNDRLTRPVMQAYDAGLNPQYLELAMAAALLFDYPEDPEAAELQSAIQQTGVQLALTQYTGIGAEHPIHALILQHYWKLKQEVQSL